MGQRAKSKNTPLRRITSKNSAYSGLDGDAVRKELRAVKFAGVAPLADTYRTSRGIGQAAFLQSVYTHVVGCPRLGKFIEDHWHERKKSEERWRRPEWTPVLLPEDVAKETGLSRQAIAYVEIDGEQESSVEDLITRGLIARKCRCGKDGNPVVSGRKPCPDGPDHYRYKPLLENWSSVRTVHEPVRKPVKSEGLSDDEEGIGQDPEGEETENCQVSSLTSDSPGKIVRVVPKRVLRLIPGRRYDIPAGDAVVAIIPEGDLPPVAAKLEEDGLHLRRAKVSADGKKAQVIPMPVVPAQPPPGSGAGDIAQSPAPPRGAPQSRGDAAPAAALHALARKALKHLDDEDAARLANAAAAIDLEQFPAVKSAVRSRYPGAENAFLQLLIAVAREACAEVKRRYSDRQLAEAIAACHSSKQERAGLYLRTLPAWILKEAMDVEAEKPKTTQELALERQLKRRQESPGIVPTRGK